MVLWAARQPGGAPHMPHAPSVDGCGKMRERGDPHAIDRLLEIAGVIRKRPVVRQVVTYKCKSDFEMQNLMTIDAQDYQ